eukprot:770216-Rhodomonas_salina.1
MLWYLVLGILDVESGADGGFQELCVRRFRLDHRSYQLEGQSPISLVPGLRQLVLTIACSTPLGAGQYRDTHMVLRFIA